jgi:hypothetical protein
MTEAPPEHRRGFDVPRGRAPGAGRVPRVLALVPLLGTTVVTADARHGLRRNDDGTALTTGLHRKAAHGSVRVHADGSYIYTPAAGFTGTDTFAYTVTDASGQTTTATATIRVVAAAVARDDERTGRTGERLTVMPLENDRPTGGSTFDTDTLHLLDPATGHMTDRFTVDGSGT